MESWVEATFKDYSRTYFGKLLSCKVTQALSKWMGLKESDTEHSLFLATNYDLPRPPS
jgi:hypothetical protein